MIVSTSKKCDDLVWDGISERALLELEQAYRKSPVSVPKIMIGNDFGKEKKYTLSRNNTRSCFHVALTLISVAAFSKSREVPLKFPLSLNLLTSFPSPSNISFSTSSSHNQCVVPSNHQLYHLLIFLIINWPSKAGPRHHLSCSRP